jgi:hypothetical protein
MRSRHADLLADLLTAHGGTIGRGGAGAIDRTSRASEGLLKDANLLIILPSRNI